jgi:hypothetical protein
MSFVPKLLTQRPVRCTLGVEHGAFGALRSNSWHRS